LSEIDDIFVIGGGINGCGIARDAAGRGYSVRLAEMNDLASGTSSWSSKLIHGGFRYLEHYEFKLVREALGERETLLKMAPHIIWPMRFVLPHHSSMRPAWLLRLGLFLYDHMGKRKLLPGTKQINLTTHSVGKPLKATYTKGFEYSDCWVNDARLVVLNAQDAQEHGAKIETHTKVISASRENDHWSISTRNLRTDEISIHKARLLVNASGPWVDKVLGEAFENKGSNNVRLVQGSHIVVPKIHDHDKAYIFQNADNRIIFALPYEQDFTLIGTTDQDYQGDPSDVKITASEIDYICSSASAYFEKPIDANNIVWSYSGVRPLFDDGATEAQEATRDYVLRVDGDDLPVINIFGGKITTYRKLSESMMDKIATLIGTRLGAWTADSNLPGGDFDVSDFDSLVAKLEMEFKFLDSTLATRLVRSYGTHAWTIMKGALDVEDMGQDFGGTLSQREIEYLMKYEWAECAEDVVWRRSKLGIRLSEMEVSVIDHWMKNKSESHQYAEKQRSQHC
jgi:glycerol-3-phosphate dehydrogenase|tara:strand:+ start:943 stop:2475 length:1533 start_codon:yes stop_codon:yes gene_type:complete